jgi:hypothetical protein
MQIDSPAFPEEIDLFSPQADLYSQIIDCYDYATKWNVRWPELESAIKENAEYAYYYARNVIKGRWPEAEPLIAKDGQWAIEYATEIYKSRWPEAEETFKTKEEWAGTYALKILKNRWPEVEHMILAPRRGFSQSNLPYLYAKDCVHGRWPEAEAVILGKFWPGDLRHIQMVSNYAKDVIKARWYEAEEKIPELLGTPTIAEDYIGNTGGKFKENRWKWLKEGPITTNLVSVLNLIGMDKEMQEYICKARPEFAIQITNLDPVLAFKYLR